MVENNPLVSILINNYNYGQFLGAAIDSALAQTYQNIEIIVVDDGSTDNSRDIIAQYGNRIIPILKENGGQASAFNVGFAISRGDIITFLDSDDEFLPDKISLVAKTLSKFPECSWFFHQIQKINLTGGELVDHPLRATVEGIKDGRSRILRGNVPFPLPSTSCLCFRRAFLAQMFPLPEVPGISINDEYIKELAAGLGKGYFSNQKLATQKIHGNNLFTHRKDKLITEMNLLVQTSYWLRKKYPEFNERANRMYAMVLLYSYRHGGLKYDSSVLADEYWSTSSVIEKIKIKILFFYYILSR